VNVLVTGSRHPLVAATARVVLEAFYKNGLQAETGHLLIHGNAPGVDAYAAEQAIGWGWDICSHPADWERHSRAAGPIRNQEMLDHHPDIDLVLAFPAPDSRGTWDMVERAIKARLTVRIHPL
jgi:YspA, cpYpsA-related SLOG family